jgi:hypothetical protein
LSNFQAGITYKNLNEMALERFGPSMLMRYPPPLRRSEPEKEKVRIKPLRERLTIIGMKPPSFYAPSLKGNETLPDGEPDHSEPMDVDEEPEINSSTESEIDQGVVDFSPSSSSGSDREETDDDDSEGLSSPPSTPSLSGASNRRRHIKVQGVPRGQKKCCICDGPNRATIPDSARIQLYVHGRVFMPASNRCCKGHLENNSTLNLDSFNLLVLKAKEIRVSDSEIFEILNLVSDHSKMLEKHARKEHFSTNEECKTLTGLSLQNFNDLNDITSKKLYNSRNRDKRTALGVFLLKIKHDLSFSLLAMWFDLGDRFVVARLVKNIANILYNDFVPQHLGYQHITRSEFCKEHKSELAHGLFAVPDDQAIAVMYATY